MPDCISGFITILMSVALGILVGEVCRLPRCRADALGTVSCSTEQTIRTRPWCNGTTHQKRHGGISWRAGSFLERVPCPLLKIKFGSFLQILWQYVTTKWMLPPGPRGDQKGFCSRTIHLQFIYFQRAEEMELVKGFSVKA